MKIAPIVFLALLTIAGCSTQTKSQTKTPLKPEPSKTECKDGDKRYYYDNSMGVVLTWPNPGPPEVCAAGKWVVDEEQLKKDRAEEAVAQAKADAERKHETELWNALRTRVITDKEMAEVLELGPSIIPAKEGGGGISWCGGSGDCIFPNDYQEQENSRARSNEEVFNAALMNQFIMRLAVEEK